MLRGSAVIALLLASTAAYTPTPAASLRLRAPQQPRAVVASRSAHPRALLGAASARRQGASLLAAVAPPQQVLRPATLALKAVLSALCSVFVVSARALAAGSSPASAAPLIPTGDVLKWGGLAAVFGAAYAFRKPETPILVETQPEAPASQTATADLNSAEPTGDADDALMSDLRKRMLSIANDEPEEEPPASSEDGWGTGPTAVLEPPKDDQPGLLDDGPVVDFPVGFPLRDTMDESAPIEPEEPPPTASAEDIAMLERMFGTRSD